MGQYIYIYTNGNDPNNAWVNDPNAWDGVDDTYATRSYSATEDNENNRLEGTANNAPGSGEQIAKVELGVEAFGDASLAGNMWNRVRPVFGGTILGNMYGALIPTYDPDSPYNWYDITNDPNAPSPWTWADIQALDMRTWFYVIPPKAGAGTIYVDQLWIRVTTAAPPAVGYSYGDSLVSVSVLAIMRKAILSVCSRVVR